MTLNEYTKIVVAQRNKLALRDKTNVVHTKVFTYKEPLPSIYEGSWKNNCTVRLDFGRLLADLTFALVN